MSLYQRVAYILPDGIVEVPAQATGGGPLGAGLFTTKRAFTYNTYAGPGVFNLDRQGLVALMWYDPNTPYPGYYGEGGYRIVTEADSSMSVRTFMESISALCAYGTADEGMSQAQLEDVARYRPVEMRCGPTTAFVRNCASKVGIQTRQVHMLNVTDQNGVDDGHIASEAFEAGKYRLYDVPNDLAWLDSNGDVMSLAAVVAQRPANSNKVILAQPRVGRPAAGAAAFAPTLYSMIFPSPQAVTDWCERIYQIPGIATPSGVVWGIPDHLSSYAANVSGYPGTNGTWTTLPWSQWVAQFYP